MNIAIAGAHGQVARLLIPKLTADGHTVVGLVRNPDHVAELESLGATGVVCDLESATPETIAAAIAGTDAAIFTAGAGAGSSAARKLTVDRDGAIKLLDAAARANAHRYVIVSSVGAENPPPADDEQVFSVYLRAKAEADAAVQASASNWTILRPGRLTDEPATGHVRLDVTPVRGEVSRGDVATVIAAVVDDPRTEAKIFYVNGGEQTIRAALEAVLAQRG
jgi:uncharacterized protein YbjT (DUF2867 family)